MAHAILLLDDVTVTARKTATLVRFYDGDAEILRAHNATEARRYLHERLADIAYLVVDLAMLKDSADDQGSVFVRWVLDQSEYEHLQIFVLTAHADMAKAVKRIRVPRLTTVVMTSDFDEVSESLSTFVENARAAYEQWHQGA